MIIGIPSKPTLILNLIKIVSPRLFISCLVIVKFCTYRFHSSDTFVLNTNVKRLGIEINVMDEI